jgi:anaerobic selenocysteine-containing dehydrogenase
LSSRFLLEARTTGRGIHGGRRVIMVNPKDIQKLGLAEGDIVDLVSESRDGAERRAEEFRIVAYSTPRGNAARMLSGDERARTARLDRRCQRHPDVGVGHRAVQRRAA